MRLTFEILMIKNCVMKITVFGFEIQFKLHKIHHNCYVMTQYIFFAFNLIGIILQVVK